MRRPKVTLKCPADAFHGPNERTIEFSSPGPVNDGNDIGGGLINIRRAEDGTVYVCVYRTDPSVVVQIGNGVRWQIPESGVCVWGPGDDGDRHLDLEKVYGMLDRIPPHVLDEYVNMKREAHLDYLRKREEEP